MGFNALKYVEKLEEAGVPEKQAKAQVHLLHEIIDSNLATKRDIKELDVKLKTDIESFKGEMKRDILATKRDIKELDVKLKTDIESFKGEMKRDIKELDVKLENVKSEMKRDIKELDVKLESFKGEMKRDIKELELKLKNDLTLRLGSMLLAGIIIVATLVKLF